MTVSLEKLCQFIYFHFNFYVRAFFTFGFCFYSFSFLPVSPLSFFIVVLTFQLFFINAIYFHVFVDWLSFDFEIWNNLFVLILCHILRLSLYLPTRQQQLELHFVTHIPAKKGEEKCINNLVICVNWAFAKDLGHYNIYRLYILYMHVYQVELIPDCIYISMKHSKISNNSQLVKLFNTFALFSTHFSKFYFIFLLFFMFSNVKENLDNNFHARNACVLRGWRGACLPGQFAFQNDDNDWQQ